MITCNEAPVLELRLALPRVGAWVADVELDSDEGIEGSAALEDGAGNAFSGTVVRSGVQVGRTLARIVGGAGGLSKTLTVRHYLATSARMVASEILAEAGEALDQNSDPMAARLDAWTRPAGTAGAALSTLAGVLGLIWRVLPGGTVWVGTDARDPVERDPDTVEIRRDPSQGLVELAVDSLWLLPGALLGAERIDRVEYSVRSGAGIRAHYWIAG